MGQEIRPLISVIVPVFNNMAFLNRCVDSILGQTYDQLEVLLIDDGSADGSGALCDMYERKDNRVKAIHKPNGGTVSARAFGLEYARGSLISFIDGDDWIDACMYEKLIGFYFRERCPDMVSSGLVYEYPESGRQRILLDGAAGGSYSELDIRQRLLPVLIYNPATDYNSILTSVCTKLIDKRVAQEAMKYMKDSLTLGEDGAYVYFLMCCCTSAAVFHDAFYHYEQHNDSQNYKFSIESFRRLTELKEVMTDGLERLEGGGIQIQGQINFYLWGYLWQAIEKQFHLGMDQFMYLFPFEKCDRGCSIVLYGAGRVGRSYFRSLSGRRFIKEITWTDKNYKKLQAAGLDVLSVEESLKRYYDYVVIAIEDEEIANQIIKELIDRGVEKEKLVWEKPVKINLYG